MGGGGRHSGEIKCSCPCSFSSLSSEAESAPKVSHAKSQNVAFVHSILKQIDKGLCWVVHFLGNKFLVCVHWHRWILWPLSNRFVSFPLFTLSSVAREKVSWEGHCNGTALNSFIISGETNRASLLALILTIRSLLTSSQARMYSGKGG